MVSKNYSEEQVEEILWLLRGAAELVYDEMSSEE